MNTKIILTLALAILVLQTNPAESQVVRDGLVSYWSFDAADVEGNTVKDGIGGNDGTIVGVPLNRSQANSVKRSNLVEIRTRLMLVPPPMVVSILAMTKISRW